MNEQWKPIDGFRGKYDISDCGRIRSYVVKANGSVLADVPVRILSQLRESCGRCSVSLWKQNREHRFKVHRLVLEAFIGLCPDGMETCHNDGNASNNHVSNLRWDTHVNNCADRKLHGTERGFKPGNCSNRKCSDVDVEWIRSVGNSLMQREIAEHVPVGSTQVSNILRGLCWRENLETPHV